MTIPRRLQHAIESMQTLNQTDRYEQLLWYANKLPAMPANHKTPDNKVPGCISEVYIYAQSHQGKIRFQGTANALLVKGIVGLLIDTLNDLPAQQIVDIPTTVLLDIGLTQTLTPSRMNATVNILETMKQKARKLQE